MKLRKFSLILLLSLCLGLVPFTASASAVVSVNAISSIHPGETVTISGTSTLSEVIIKVLRPGNSTVFFDIAKVTDGQFTDSFTLGSNEPAGIYKVIVGQANQVATQDLVVAAAPDATPTPDPDPTPSPSPTGTIIVGDSPSDKVTSTDGKLTLPVGKPGEVSLGDEITISIPADASGKELKLTIEKLLNTQNLLMHKEVLASPIYEILKNFSENFNKPITLTFTFDPTSLKGNQKPVVFYYDEVKKEWVKVGGNANGNKITVEVNHFTKYAVIAVDSAEDVPPMDVNFSDIAGHWAEASIKQAVSIGIVKGYADGTFKPGKTVTRAEFSVMLMNALKPQEAGAELTFTDSAKIGVWAQKAVAQAVQAGIIKGYKDGSFRPNAEITRTEMAAMIANALKLSIESTDVTGFADDKDIPSWVKGAVAAIKKLGLMEGTGTNQFNPNAQATRAEAVTVLLKMLALESK
ncbi:S-layer homology domain-containing protein [Cohnella suwonensis]|uniref:S-layer homology domain-containing protein n=1 Tax=Cohnella suwonensis TaxID=696072 RepID=A0ABW0M2I8_9BACL